MCHRVELFHHHVSRPCSARAPFSRPNLRHMSSLLSAAFARAQTCTTLDASVLVTVLLLLGCHGMARGLPAQLRDADGGGRAAALTRESLTVHVARASSGKAPCRAWTSSPLPAEATARSYSIRRTIPCVSTLCESVVLACSAACRIILVYW